MRNTRAGRLEYYRDKTDMRPGDLISGFMKRIGLADHVIVVLSDKYLRSPYCMTELHYIYQRSLGEKEDFLYRIFPLRLTDAQLGTWRDRVTYAEYWEAEFKAMESTSGTSPRRTSGSTSRCRLATTTSY